jgi:hypothetical protein
VKVTEGGSLTELTERFLPLYTLAPELASGQSLASSTLSTLVGFHLTWTVALFELLAITVTSLDQPFPELTSKE